MDRDLVPAAISHSDPSSVGQGRSCPKTLFWDDAGRVGAGLTVGGAHRCAAMRSLKTLHNSDCLGTTAPGRVSGTARGSIALNRSRHW